MVGLNVPSCLELLTFQKLRSVELIIQDILITRKLGEFIRNFFTGLAILTYLIRGRSVTKANQSYCDESHLKFEIFHFRS